MNGKKWYQTSGPDSDIVISTRVRLARNLKNYPFPAMLGDQKIDEVNRLIRDTLIKGRSSIAKDFEYTELKNLSQIELISLIERHLISPDLAKKQDTGAVLFNQDESISIMLCEEDHLRIQIMRPGLALKEAYDLADKFDTLLNESLGFAFDDSLGYLTSCPTNLGTAMRVSCMVHLPVMEQNGTLRRIADNISKLGLTIRGMYGEGSASKAGIYQISNRETLGISELSTIGKLEDIIAQISKIEREQRQEALKRADMTDYVYRAQGLLRSARMLPGEEFATLYSALRLGVIGDLIDDITLDKLSELFVEAQPATLMKSLGKELTPSERDAERANLVRKALT